MSFKPPVRIMLRDMKARNNAEVDMFIAKLKPPDKELVKALRKLVLETSPMEEAVKWGFPHFSQNGAVCAIIPYKDHVNLEFYRGTELNDPNGLLEGTGKKLRHVKIRKLDDVKTGALKELLLEAVVLNKLFAFIIFQRSISKLCWFFYF